MKNLLFLLASLVAATLFAQPLPYVVKDTSFIQGNNQPLFYASVLSVLPDNSLIFSGMATVAGEPDHFVVGRVAAQGYLQWEVNLGSFMPCKVIPGPGQGITLVGIEFTTISTTAPAGEIVGKSAKVIDDSGIIISSTSQACVDLFGCSIMAYAADPQIFNKKGVILSDGSSIYLSNTVDSTKTDFIERYVFTMSRHGADGGKIWSKLYPHHYLGVGGLLALPNDEVMMIGIHHSYLPSYENDNASFTIDASGTVLGSSLVPNRDYRTNPYTSGDRKFFAGHSGGAWVYTEQNGTMGLNDPQITFPVLRIGHLCDTVFKTLVSFSPPNAWGAYPQLLSVMGSAPTPDDGALFLVRGSSYTAQDEQHYLIKLKADGTTHWVSYASGLLPNNGGHLHLTNSGDIIQFDPYRLHFTRWHVPAGTGVTESVAQSALSVAPNPVKDVLTATFTAPVTGQITLTISDLAGRQFQRQPMQAVAGANQGQLSVAALAPGMYVLSVAGATGAMAQTVFVKE